MKEFSDQIFISIICIMPVLGKNQTNARNQRHRIYTNKKRKAANNKSRQIWNRAKSGTLFSGGGRKRRRNRKTKRRHRRRRRVRHTRRRRR